MINTLYNQIQTQEKASFDELFQKNSAEVPTKSELGALLRTLENEGKVFQYAGSYYDLQKFPEIEGFVQWNLTGFCWLSDKNEMNDWGITFNPDDNLLSIYNKRDAYFGHYIKGKKVTIKEKDSEREFVYITSSELTKEAKVIATYNKSRNEWVILNSATNFNFKNKSSDNNSLNSALEDGEIAIFKNDKDVNNYHFIEKLGNIKDYGIESKIIAKLSDIVPAPKSEFKEVSSSEIKKLDKAFYTIDSLDTKDIDDAIYIEKNQDGYHLWVAIADVSSYVKPNDPQDLHAKQSCSSFYLPHDTIHMLDRQLAENYCSLNPGANKQAMICEMTFDNDGKLQSKDFYQAQILSQARLTYNDVDKLIEDINPEESFHYKNGVVEKMKTTQDNPQLIDSLKVLNEFSKTQARTDERSYWVVESPEYKLGEDGKIEYLYEKDESKPSQKMVETAMLAANICAAQLLHEADPDLGVFRNQLEPAKDEFPKPAIYEHTNVGHWGLKTKFYTHFTSPIRRYCDLLVHRLIKSIILKDEKVYNHEQLKEMVEQINLQQYKAKQFNIKARNLLLPQYLEKLLATHQFDEKLKVVDYSDTGVVTRNKQHIEIFIPTFKLDKDFSKEVTKYLPKDGETISNEDKTAVIKKFNKEWMLFSKISNFSWTDDRKNAFYQIGRRQSKPKPNNDNRNNENRAFKKF